MADSKGFFLTWERKSESFNSQNRIKFELWPFSNTYNHEYMNIRAHWQIFFFHFNFWYTFSSVLFNSKTGLFSYIFWFGDSFLCKFTYSHLLSRLQDRICQKIYDGRKKYFGLTNGSFQCHTSSWNTPITIRKRFQNFTKVTRSPFFCPPILVKIA